MTDRTPAFQIDVEPLYVLIEGQSTDLPSRSDLQAALNLLFWISLEKDEGRPVTGSFVFTGQDNCSHSLRFKEGIPFDDVGAIRRIAMADDPDTSALALHEGVIWGIALTLPESSLFLTIAEPGKLLVRHGVVDVIGGFSRGVLSGFGSSGQGISLGEIQKRHSLSDKVFKFLIDQSAWLRRLGHGGAIIVVPDDAGEHLSNDFDLAHEVVNFERARNWPGQTAAETKLERDPENDEIRIQVNLQRLHRDTAERRLAQSVARLSSVDGAVLVNTDLRVVAFAAKIKAPLRHDEEVDRHRLGEPKDVVRIAKLGAMRHQSAASYASTHPGSTVLVVSQDGTVSLMSRSESDARVQVTTGLESMIPLNATSLRFANLGQMAAELSSPTLEAAGG